MTMDFEASVLKAVCCLLPYVKVNFCRFLLSQAWMKHVGEKWIRCMYFTKDNFHYFLEYVEPYTIVKVHCCRFHKSQAWMKHVGGKWIKGFLEKIFFT